MDRLRSSNSVRKRICRKLLVVLLVIGVPAALFQFTFSLKKADVIGAERYSDSQIRERVLKSSFDRNCAILYLKYRFFKTPVIPFVEKINVEMDNTHTVTLFVYEKMVAGCVKFMGEYLYFDKDGIVVESSPEKVEDVPVINGLKYNKIVLHEKLKIQNNNSVQNGGASINQSNKAAGIQSDYNTISQDQDMFSTIINLTKLISKNKLNVDAVNFNENNEVTLQCGKIWVLLGKKSSYDEPLSDLGNILKKAKGTKLYELDMRQYTKETGRVIGKTK
jgi:hypothetical protein